MDKKNNKKAKDSTLIEKAFNMLPLILKSLPYLIDLITKIE